MSVSSAQRVQHAQEGQAERAKLVGSATVIGLGTLTSRVLGLFRHMTLAALFSSAETDAFFVAFTIPNALRQLLGEGAVASAVVPVLSAQLRLEGKERAQDFFAKMRGMSLVALVTVTALGMILAPQLCELFAGGYHARPAEFERTVRLTRVLFPYIFFMGSAALGMAALNSQRKFAVAAFAPGLLNISFLICAFVLRAPLERLGLDRTYALAVGALIGGLLQMLAQWPSLRKSGFLGRIQLAWKDDAVREVFRRMGPIMVGSGIYYIDIILSRRFLSELGPGAQSYFSWAFHLCDFPQGIFIMALSTAALPSLSAFAAQGALDEVSKTYAHSLRYALFVGVPSSIALIFLAEPIVVALFQRGEFTAMAAHETAKALIWQGGAIWAVAVVRQLVAVYYALGDTQTPVVISALDLGVFVGTALLLRNTMGHVAISVAIATSSIAQMIMLWGGLRGRLRNLRMWEILESVLRTVIASLIAGVGAWGLCRLFSDGGSEPLRIARGLVASVTYGLLFLAAAWGLRSPELDALARRIRARLSPKAE